MILIGKEKDILDFVTSKMEKKEKEKLECKIQAMELLKACNFSEDYIAVVLCQDLIGKENVSDDELARLVGMEAFEAIKIADSRQNPNLGTERYLQMVKKNKLANIALTATLTSMLHMAIKKPKEIQDQLIYKTEKYYLKFLEGTPGYLFLKEGYEALKISNQ